MKAVLTTLVLLAFITSGSTTLAQEPPQHRQGMMMGQDTVQAGMMQHPMMRMMHEQHQQMMQNPMHRTMMTAHVLPALRDTLGLSDEQVRQLEQMQAERRQQQEEHRRQMMEEQQNLMRLFEEDEPVTMQVREHFETMAQQRAEQQAAMYGTALRMREVLTEEQRQMLDDMTPEERMRHMMHNMSMMEMMEMMQSRPGTMMQMGPGMMRDDGRPGGRQSGSMMRNSEW